MFIDRLINQTNGPLVERVLQFAEARHKVIAENMTNVDTPNYRQKDLSPTKFFAMLRERAAQRAEAAPGTVTFDDVESEVGRPSAGILFHDGNNRSMEELTTEQAKNGMLYTMAIEILRKQFAQMQQALKERVS